MGGRRSEPCEGPPHSGTGPHTGRSWRLGIAEHPLDRPAASGLHDWDSVIAQPETAIVGLAAAVWPAAGAPGEAASVIQSSDFIQSYQLAAGRQWTGQETRDSWAAGLWVRLFNAKKDAAEGGGMQLDRLADEIAERLILTGLE